MIQDFKNKEDYKKIAYYLLFFSLATLIYCTYIFYINLFYQKNILNDFFMKIHYPYTIGKLAYLKAIPLIFTLSCYLIWHSTKPITKELKRKYNNFGIIFLILYITFCVIEIFYFNNLITLIVSLLLYAFALYFFLETKKTEVIDLKNDRRNLIESQFEQYREEILTPVSVNIKYEYNYKGNVLTSNANVVNPFRGSLVGGTPGSGKTFAIIEEYIRQFIEKGFTGAIYDYKYPTLTKKVYNYLNWYIDEEHISSYEMTETVEYVKDINGNKNEIIKKINKLNNGNKIPIINKTYPVKPKFFVINLDDPAFSHRCNPISEDSLKVIADADDATKNLMLNINRSWIEKEGDFFTDSANVYTSMLMWYLKLMSKKYDYDVCSLPHLIALSTFPSTEIMFLILVSYNDLKPKMTPFMEALEKGALEQLAGQVASAGIALSKISSPELFYILTGNDFDFNLNDPLNPKIVSISNNPERDDTYAAPLGLILAKIIKSINVQVFNTIDNKNIKRNNVPSFFIIDEFPTIFLRSIDKLIATARSNKVATVLGFQSFAQIIAGYSKEVADKIIRVCGNRFAGQLMDEDADIMSKTIGKHKVLQKSYNYSSQDLSENQQVAMEEIVPASTIAQLSQGQFVGIIADEFEFKEDNKIMYGAVKPPMELKKQEENIDLPIIRDFTPNDLNNNILKFKNINNNIINDIIDFFAKTSLSKLVEYADFDNKKLLFSIIESFDIESKNLIDKISEIENNIKNSNNKEYKEELILEKENYNLLLINSNIGINFHNYNNFKNFYEILDLKNLINKILLLHKNEIKDNAYLEKNNVERYIDEAIKNGIIIQNKNKIIKDYENNIYNDIFRIVALEIEDLSIIQSFLQKKPNGFNTLINLFKNIINNENFTDNLIKSDYEKYINELEILQDN